ncbi:MAG: hypothetical protein OSJ31_03155 [Alistipes sp.]|nr:hypothetical protein [Alistipes sp.]
MKNILYIIAASLALLTTACSDSDDRPVNTTPEKLDGSEWYGECEDDKTQNKYAATLTFGNDGTCTWVLRDEIGDLFSSTQYLYEYNSPNVTIYLSEPDAETGDLKAAFNGYVLDKDQATIGGRNVYTMWLYDTQHNPAAYFWQY